MSLFKAKQEWWTQGWNQIKSLYPPGRTFSFMTQSLAVTKYNDNTFPPTMHTAYVDGGGVIREKVFDVLEIPVLLEIDAANKAAK